MTIEPIRRIVEPGVALNQRFYIVRVEKGQQYCQVEMDSSDANHRRGILTSTSICWTQYESKVPIVAHKRFSGDFIAVGGVMLAGLVAIFFIARAAIEADRNVLSQHIIVGELKDGLSMVKGAETGGNLLTGDEKYLEPYEQAFARIHQEVGTLHARALAGELSYGDMGRLRKLIDQKLVELEETITLRRTKGLPAALEVVKTDAGQRTMEAIRLQIAQMIAQQESILGRAHNKAVNLVYYRNLIIALSTLLNLAVLFWSYR
jgi:CHASE3 domain sensor protein